MSTYIVSFEIKDPEKKVAVIGKLKAYGTYCPINEYCWAIVTEQKAVEIRDALKVGLEATDRLFVIRSGTEGAWLNAYGTGNTEWLKKHL